MSPTVERMELEDWFKLVWRDTEGAVKLSFQTKDLEWKNVMFNWPAAKDTIVDWVMAKVGTGSDVFYAPAIFKDRSSGLADNVKGTWCLWVDFDGNGPADWSEAPETISEPSVRVQSSGPGNQHCYWMLDEFIDKPTLEGKNRALAYELQADHGGWDAGQVLRPPTTVNSGFTKPERDGRIYPVEVLDMSKTVYNPDFIEAPKFFVDLVRASIDLSQLPSLGSVLAKGKFPEKFQDSYFRDEPPEKGDRSFALMEVGYFGAEAGLSDTDIYVLVDEADKRWGKYVNRTADRRFAIISDIVERARLKHPRGGEDLVSMFNSGKVEKPTQIVYTHREFLSAERHLEWDYHDLLTRFGFGMLAGEPGVGKTQIFNQFARSTASGQDFLLWKNAGQPRRVLYLGLEMSFEGLQFFLKTADTADEETTALIDQNLLVAPLSSTLPLDTDQGKKFLIDLTVQHQPEFVIIDSLAKATHAALNDEVAMRRLNDWVQEYRQRFGVSFAFVHHTKKVQLSNGKTSATNGIDDMFGSRFLAGDLDFLLTFAKAKPKGSIYARHAKARYGPESDDFTMVRRGDFSFEITQIHSDNEEAGETLIDKFLNRRSGTSGGTSSGATESGSGIW